MAILLAMEGAISQGILWGLMTLGVYLTFRILNVADMTVDGSFAAGGAVTAILITNGMNPVLSLLFGIIYTSMLSYFLARTVKRSHARAAESASITHRTSAAAIMGESTIESHILSAEIPKERTNAENIATPTAADCFTT